MNVLAFESEPLFQIQFLNAGRRSGEFTTDLLPIHQAKVDSLPDDLDAVILTADLQGRERFQEAGGKPLRLLGEVLPDCLMKEVFPLLGLHDARRIGAVLAGDFYTVPGLDRRGGTGDVSAVWRAFGDPFAWVVGVAGNHDTFGEGQQTRPRFSSPFHFLDGTSVALSGLRVAGVSGIVGNPSRIQRRTEEDFLFQVEWVLEETPDLLVMHDGPEGTERGQRGSSRVRLLLERKAPTLVVRGHAHWQHPFAELENGTQIVNVDARVVILVRH
ncbi:putative phosphoesterase [Planctomycetales bacterium 10988]|nr:putative phosphoesterase [Planctomycetales bacterium 10988]